MNRLSTVDRCRVLACLVEGNSIRATVRITTEARKAEGWGDIWTWVAIDPETKLIPAWYVGNRTTMDGYRFFRNLSPRLANRVQACIKVYAESGEGKYSPGEVTGTKREIVFGCPNRALISTSHAERQNLTMRMQMRRFTRLTNAHSKSALNHRLAVALHFVHYNFARIHSAHRITPAMAAGLTDHVWELSEIVGLLTGARGSDAEQWSEPSYYRTRRERDQIGAANRILGGIRTHSYEEKVTPEKAAELLED